MKQKIILLFIFFILIRYSPPLTNLATQTEFSQPQKDCSGSSKDGHGLKYEWWIVELIYMSVVKGKSFRASSCFIVDAHFCASKKEFVECDFLDKTGTSLAWRWCKSVHFGFIKTSSKELDIKGLCYLHQD